MLINCKLKLKQIYEKKQVFSSLKQELEKIIADNEVMSAIFIDFCRIIDGQ